MSGRSDESELLQTCCLCCSTRTGSIITGIVNVICSGVLFVLCVVALAHWENVTDRFSGLRPSDRAVIEVYLLSVIICTLIFMISYVVTGGLLLFGIAKIRPKFFLPWMWNNGIGIISNGVSMLYLIFKVGFTRLHLMIFICAFGFLELGLQMYCALVVYSYYKQLKNSLQNPSADSANNRENDENKMGLTDYLTQYLRCTIFSVKR